MWGDITGEGVKSRQRRGSLCAEVVFPSDGARATRRWGVRMRTHLLRWSTDYPLDRTRAPVLHRRLREAVLGGQVSRDALLFIAEGDDRSLLLADHVAEDERGAPGLSSEWLLATAGVVVSGTDIWVCEARHWYWNATNCAQVAGCTLITKPTDGAVKLMQTIDTLAKRALTRRVGFVDFQLLQDIHEPGRIAVVHQWSSATALAAVRRETRVDLEATVGADAHVMRFVSLA
jgi:hypothetical protein